MRETSKRSLFAIEQNVDEATTPISTCAMNRRETNERTTDSNSSSSLHSPNTTKEVQSNSSAIPNEQQNIDEETGIRRKKKQPIKADQSNEKIKEQIEQSNKGGHVRFDLDDKRKKNRHHSSNEVKIRNKHKRNHSRKRSSGGSVLITSHQRMNNVNRSSIATSFTRRNNGASDESVLQHSPPGVSLDNLTASRLRKPPIQHKYVRQTKSVAAKDRSSIIPDQSSLIGEYDEKKQKHDNYQYNYHSNYPPHYTYQSSYMFDGKASDIQTQKSCYSTSTRSGFNPQSSIIHSQYQHTTKPIIPPDCRVHQIPLYHNYYNAYTDSIRSGKFDATILKKLLRLNSNSKRNIFGDGSSYDDQASQYENSKYSHLSKSPSPVIMKIEKPTIANYQYSYNKNKEKLFYKQRSRTPIGIFDVSKQFHTALPYIGAEIRHLTTQNGMKFDKTNYNDSQSAYNIPTAFRRQYLIERYRRMNWNPPNAIKFMASRSFTDTNSVYSTIINPNQWRQRNREEKKRKNRQTKSEYRPSTTNEKYMKEKSVPVINIRKKSHTKKKKSKSKSKESTHRSTISKVNSNYGKDTSEKMMTTKKDESNENEHKSGKRSQTKESTKSETMDETNEGEGAYHTIYCSYVELQKKLAKHLRKSNKNEKLKKEHVPTKLEWYPNSYHEMKRCFHSNEQTELFDVDVTSNISAMYKNQYANSMPQYNSFQLEQMEIILGMVMKFEKNLNRLLKTSYRESQLLQKNRTLFAQQHKGSLMWLRWAKQFNLMPEKMKIDLLWFNQNYMPWFMYALSFAVDTVNKLKRLPNRWQISSLYPETNQYPQTAGLSMYTSDSFQQNNQMNYTDRYYQYHNVQQMYDNSYRYQNQYYYPMTQSYPQHIEQVNGRSTPSFSWYDKMYQRLDIPLKLNKKIDSVSLISSKLTGKKDNMDKTVTIPKAVKETSEEMNTIRRVPVNWLNDDDQINRKVSLKIFDDKQSILMESKPKTEPKISNKYRKQSVNTEKLKNRRKSYISRRGVSNQSKVKYLIESYTENQNKTIDDEDEKNKKLNSSRKSNLTEKSVNFEKSINNHIIKYDQLINNYTNRLDEFQKNCPENYNHNVDNQTGKFDVHFDNELSKIDNRLKRYNYSLNNKHSIIDQHIDTKSINNFRNYYKREPNYSYNYGRRSIIGERTNASIISNRLDGL